MTELLKTIIALTREHKGSTITFQTAKWDVAYLQIRVSYVDINDDSDFASKYQLSTVDIGSLTHMYHPDAYLSELLKAMPIWKELKNAESNTEV